MGAQSEDLGPALEKHMHDWGALFYLRKLAVHFEDDDDDDGANTYMTIFMC